MRMIDDEITVKKTEEKADGSVRRNCSESTGNRKWAN